MTKDTPTPTIVIFRVWPDGNVLALFPEIPADNDGNLCSSYQHIGQHGAADYTVVMKRSKPATPAEYRELAIELREIGYTLNIRKRATHQMRRKRMQNAAQGGD